MEANHFIFWHNDLVFHFGIFMENNSMWRVLSLIMKYCHPPLRSEKMIVKSQNHLSFYQQYSAYILTEILGKFSHLWDICVMQFSGINKLDATFNKWKWALYVSHSMIHQQISSMIVKLKGTHDSLIIIFFHFFSFFPTIC